MAAIANATRASGVIVRVKPEDFLVMLNKQEKPLVVHSISRLLRVSCQYLMRYKGLVFYTKSKNPLMLPGDTNLLYGRSVLIP